MRTRSAKLQYLLLGFVVAGSMLFYVANMTAAFDSLTHHAERARLPFDFSGDPRWALKPLPEALEAGVHPQDIILSIDGVPFTGMAGLIDQTHRAHAGQKLTILYRTPAGKTRIAHIALVPLLSEAPRFAAWLVILLRIAIFPAFCLGLGFWVVLAKPRDRNAWFLLGIMNVIPVSLGLWDSYPVVLTPFTLAWQVVASRGMFISLLLFGIYFPVRSRLDERFPWIKWLLIVPQILIVPCAVLLTLGVLYHVHAVHPYLWATPPLHLIGNICDAVSLIVFIAAIVWKLFTVPDADARRRLGVVTAGSVLGLLPILGLLIGLTVSRAPFSDVLPPWVLITVVLLFASFPLSLAYTVIVQRALDVRILLRQGTRYALARGTLWALQAAVLIYLGYSLVQFVHETRHRGVHLIAPVVFVLSVLFLRTRIARPLSLWLDRRFFREAYSTEQVLSELSEQVRDFRENGPLLHTIMQRIAETLHVKSIAVFLRQENAFRLQYAHGLTEVPDLSLPKNSPTIRALARSRGALRANPEILAPLRAIQSNPSMQADLDTEWMLPLHGSSQLVGFLALGGKRSEEPYSPVDRRMLNSVALQTGLAIENNELIHSLAEREAQRRRIQRDIEIAQEVQARLFPQELPKVAGVDLAGFCRTAQEIGGDYYDFISLENGHLGIALGDVSGKGISAALLMASIRAALRGLTLSGALAPAQLIERMNRIAFDSSTSNRFTTFFYAEYDPSTRHLQYVNAGHDPPILLRASQAAADAGCGPDAHVQIQRLEIGGPIMGIFSEAQYQQGRLDLMPCDVLIAFTDGLSEAMNEEQQEWSDERIVETAQAFCHLPAREILSRLVDGADQFTGGAPQHDDLTLVVVKVA